LHVTSIQQVCPWTVQIGKQQPADVLLQRGRLQREGQIEPIAVVAVTNCHTRRCGCTVLIPDPDGWCYAEAQVAAARDLGWPTILIVEGNDDSD
jgi:hypothetical protein